MPRPTKRRQPVSNAKSASALVQKYREKNDTDLFLFSGLIRGGQIWKSADAFVDAILANKNPRPNVALFLTTYGGDPDSAYRMARSLRRTYKKFRLLIAGPCKSAGTLIALGADELVFGPAGELGPLDVQLAKPDEIANVGSGLDIFTALEIVTSHAFQKFEEYMLELTGGTGGIISTKTASEIGVQLITGLFNPIAAQIDPLRLGEAQRAINIAKAYGKRLGLKNLRPNALDQLVESYPSHPFVIDAEEAKTLFVRVESLSETECALMALLGNSARYPSLTQTNFQDVCQTFKSEDMKDAQPKATRRSTKDTKANGTRTARAKRPTPSHPNAAPKDVGLARGAALVGNGARR